MNIQIPEVTLCAVDTACPQLAALALTKSAAQINFARVVLFTTSTEIEFPYEIIIVPEIRSKSEYSKFVYSDLVKYINTSHVLISQWDGYIVNPNCWNSKFLEYDLIGAKWPWHPVGSNVGNGGFSLRSHKLLSTLCSNSFPFDEKFAEDELISRVYKNQLVEFFDIKFAPEEIADRFSYERSSPEFSTLGFHGLFNMWRYVEDEEMLLLIEYMTPNIIRSVEFIELVCIYLNLRKFNMVENMSSKFLKICGNKNKAFETFAKFGTDHAVINRILSFSN